MGTKIPRKVMKDVRARRERLRAMMDRLEAALGTPLPKRERAWLKGVRAAFRELEAAVTDHIAGVEADDGLFAQVRTDAPRLVGMIRRLESDHSELADAVQVLGKRLTDAKPAANMDRVRRDLLQLLGRLTHHRQLGADLLYEAYVLDVSVGD
jgi:hypothetical protein